MTSRNKKCRLVVELRYFTVPMFYCNPVCVQIPFIFCIINVDDLVIGIFIFSGKETPVILGRLAAIEAQQHVHTQMLHTLLRASQQQEQLEACQLPEGIHLPLDTL